MKIRPVILCGGSGTRLWPLSRKSMPKQFAPIVDGKSLLQITLERVSGNHAKNFFLKKNIELNEVPLCVGSEIHLHLINEIASLTKIKIEIIAEPFSRNTAAAMTAASLKSNPDEVLIFCPSDHFIPKNNEYLESLVQGLKSTDRNTIVSLGVVPEFPSSAYGYLLTKKAMRWFWNKFESSAENQSLNTFNLMLYKGEAIIPKTIIVTAGFDPLSDEAEGYAFLLHESGTSVKQLHYPSLFHGFASMTRLKAAKKAVNDFLSEYKKIL